MNEMRKRINEGWELSLSVANYPALVLKIIVAGALMALLWLLWFVRDTGVYMCRLWGKLREWALLAFLWGQLAVRRALPVVIGAVFVCAAEVAILTDVLSARMALWGDSWSRAWAWRADLLTQTI